MLLIKGLLAVVIFIVFPLCIGDYMCMKTHIDEKTGFDSGILRLLVGNVMMWAVYEMIAVPLILLKQKFMLSVYLWLGIILILSVLDIFFVFKTRVFCGVNIKKLSGIKRNTYGISLEKVFTIVVAIITIGVILFQCYQYICKQHIDIDDSRFVVNACEAYDNNTMLLNNPATGDYQEMWRGELLKDIASPWCMYIALISKLIYIYPTIVAHTILPVILLLFAYGSYWLLGKKLFRGDIVSSLLFVFFAAFLNVFFNASVYTESVFLLTRVWQGKSIIAGVLLPFLLYMLYSQYQQVETRSGQFVLLGLTNIAMCLMSGMGIFFSGLFTGVFGIYYMFIKRNWKGIMGIVICCIPNLIYAFIYIKLK